MKRFRIHDQLLTTFDFTKIISSDDIIDSVVEYSDGDCRGGHGFNTNLSGERGMWCAVIHLAYEDLSSKNKRLRSRAKAFFADWPDSGFGWICELLDLNADQIRMQLKERGLL